MRRQAGSGVTGRKLPALGLCALLLAALWAGPAGAEDGQAIGAVGALVGEARISRDGEIRPLAVGTEVFEGDRISTGAGAKLRLDLDDGSLVTLGEATSLDLTRFRRATERSTRDVLLEVPRGIIRVLVALLAPDAAFQLQTMTAVASARGTEWIAEASADASALVSLHGRVAVRGLAPAPAGEVVLGPGEGTTVPAGEPPQAVKTWGAARKNAFIERTRLP